MSDVSHAVADPAGSEELPQTVEVGLVVTPLVEEATAAELAEEVARELAERHPSVGWKITVVREPLVTGPAPVSEIIDAARARLLEAEWDLVVHLTDLPMVVSRRPVLAHSSRTHRAAVVSLPALGLKQSVADLARSIADAITVLASDGDASGSGDAGGRFIQRRLLDLASEAGEPDALEGIALVPRVATGNIRLLVGMVRANRPWRLVSRLTRAMIGALGVAAFAVITADVWRISATIGTMRLALICFGTLVVAVGMLIAVHGLWERAPDPRVREQVILFNLVTAITVTFGIAALFVALFAISLFSGWLVIEPRVLARAIGGGTSFVSYARLALIASALATLGGALGGLLESDAAVREAAYGFRPGSP